MTRIDRARYLGGLAACVLAAGVFAPMMSFSLRAGTHWQPLAAEIRVTYLILAAGSALAALKRAFGVAAFFGAIAFANGLFLLALTIRGIVEGQAHAWLRPGWGYVPLLAAGLALATLPWWAGATQTSDRPSASRVAATDGG